MKRNFVISVVLPVLVMSCSKDPTYIPPPAESMRVQFIDFHTNKAIGHLRIEKAFYDPNGGNYISNGYLEADESGYCQFSDIDYKRVIRPVTDEYLGIWYSFRNNTPGINNYLVGRLKTDDNTFACYLYPATKAIVHLRQTAEYKELIPDSLVYLSLNSYYYADYRNVQVNLLSVPLSNSRLLDTTVEVSLAGGLPNRLAWKVSTCGDLYYLSYTNLAQGEFNKDIPLGSAPVEIGVEF